MSIVIELPVSCDDHAVYYDYSLEFGPHFNCTTCGLIYHKDGVN